MYTMARKVRPAMMAKLALRGIKKGVSGEILDIDTCYGR